MLQQHLHCVAQQLGIFHNTVSNGLYLRQTVLYFSALSISLDLRSNMERSLETSRTSTALKSKLVENKLLSAASAVKTSKVSKRK